MRCSGKLFNPPSHGGLRRICREAQCISDLIERYGPLTSLPLIEEAMRCKVTKRAGLRFSKRGPPSARESGSEASFIRFAPSSPVCGQEPTRCLAPGNKGSVFFFLGISQRSSSEFQMGVLLVFLPTEPARSDLEAPEGHVFSVLP